jgi:hypothetical protein
MISHPLLPFPFPSPDNSGYTPAQIQKAYGIDQLFGIIGNGAGQTIAIVDAYDDPAFVNSTAPNFSSSDLAKFDAQFGLPDPPSFVKLNQAGGTTLPGTDPNKGWEGEEALDVEWAHALAPGANIILYEANSAFSSDLNAAIAAAKSNPAVSVISMSFGGPENAATDPTNNALFTTPAGHQGITFLAATGDSGSFGSPGSTSPIVDYPAASPNVVAVGGTNLQLNPDNSYKSETGWGNGANSNTQGGSGGGISQFEPEPDFQQSVQQTGRRTTPDVAFDADPNTGVWVYDSFTNGNSTPWDVIGGTSFACPAWAALIAIADQGLAAEGASTLDGPSQTLPDLYALYQSKPGDFHDITSGNNGAYSAGPGYDEVTGLGTPLANLLIPDLVAQAGLQIQDTVSGVLEGQPINNAPVAVFTDPGGGGNPGAIYDVSIAWGDGTKTAGNVVPGSGNSYTVTGSHIYGNPGGYNFTVSVTNTVTGLSGSSTIRLNVGDAPLAAGPVQTASAQVGVFLTNALVGVFTDTDVTARPPSMYSATINWFLGPNQVVSTSGRLVPIGNSSFEVFGDNPFTYAGAGAYGVQVVVRDAGGAATVLGGVVNVTGNSAFGSLFPQVSGDSNFTGSPFADLQNALANLITAEQFFINALLFGPAAAVSQAMPNLLNAFNHYEMAVIRYDLTLPMGS